jgi:2,3-bisphosphoglycerate-independent phosphoglycerate mutase
MILDGWGLRTMEHGNAVVLGNTPNYDRWTTTMERCIVAASEEAVGLVPDQMGNSEVGHLNLGAGRIVYQDISRIDISIRDQTLYEHPMLLEAASRVTGRGSKLHLLGLLGPGGVHAHDNHLHALLQFTKRHNIVPVLHIVTDGRDTPPESGAEYQV